MSTKNSGDIFGNSSLHLQQGGYLLLSQPKRSPTSLRGSLTRGLDEQIRAKAHRSSNYLTPKVTDSDARLGLAASPRVATRRTTQAVLPGYIQEAWQHDPNGRQTAGQRYEADVASPSLAERHAPVAHSPSGSYEVHAPVAHSPSGSYEVPRPSMSTVNYQYQNQPLELHLHHQNSHESHAWTSTSTSPSRFQRSDVPYSTQRSSVPARGTAASPQAQRPNSAALARRFHRFRRASAGAGLATPPSSIPRLPDLVHAGSPGGPGRPSVVTGPGGGGRRRTASEFTFSSPHRPGTAAGDAYTRDASSPSSMFVEHRPGTAAGDAYTRDASSPSSMFVEHRRPATTCRWAPEDPADGRAAHHAHPTNHPAPVHRLNTIDILQVDHGDDTGDSEQHFASRDREQHFTSRAGDSYAVDRFALVPSQRPRSGPAFKDWDDSSAQPRARTAAGLADRRPQDFAFTANHVQRHPHATPLAADIRPATSPQGGSKRHIATVAQVDEPLLFKSVPIGRRKFLPGSLRYEAAASAANIGQSSPPMQQDAGHPAPTPPTQPWSPRPPTSGRPGSAPRRPLSSPPVEPPSRPESSAPRRPLSSPPVEPPSRPESSAPRRPLSSPPVDESSPKELVFRAPHDELTADASPQPVDAWSDSDRPLGGEQDEQRRSLYPSDPPYSADVWRPPSPVYLRAASSPARESDSFPSPRQQVFSSSVMGDLPGSAAAEKLSDIISAAANTSVHGDVSTGEAIDADTLRYAIKCLEEFKSLLSRMLNDDSSEYDTIESDFHETNEALLALRLLQSEFGLAK